MKLNFKVILVGFIVAVCFAPFLDVLIFSIIGGLAVGLWIADYRNGAINGLISMAIASGLFLAVNATIIYPAMFLTQPVETILLWVFCIFLGVLGSIFGVFIRKMTINIQQSRSTSKLEEKGYLLCTECGGYYQLKNGETPEDYEECECGGKFEYKGPEISDKPAKSGKKFGDLFAVSSIWRRVIAVSSGVIIILVISTLLEGYLPCIVLLHSHISGLMILAYLFTLLIAGFVTAFIAGENYKEGLINSAVAGLIGGILAFLLGGYMGWYLAEGNIPVYFMTSFIFNLILIDVTLSTVGGIINIYTKNRRTDTGTYICDNCGNYYELSPGESAEDYELKCDCGSNLTHAKKISLLVLIIGYLFAILGGIIGVLIGWYLYTRNNPHAKFHGRNMTIIAFISITLGLIFSFSLYSLFTFF